MIPLKYISIYPGVSNCSEQLCSQFIDSTYQKSSLSLKAWTWKIEKDKRLQDHQTRME